MKRVLFIQRGTCRRTVDLRRGLRALLAAVSFAGLLGAAAAAQAQTPAPKSLDLRPLPGGALPRDSQGIDMRVALAAPRAAEPSIVGTRSAAPRATLIEMPSDQVPGQFSRPKYALGFRSDGLKQFAKGMGLDAETCLAPLIRGRVSFTAAGDGSARLMVFARCSFH